MYLQHPYLQFLAYMICLKTLTNVQLFLCTSIIVSVVRMCAWILFFIPLLFDVMRKIPPLSFFFRSNFIKHIFTLNRENQQQRR